MTARRSLWLLLQFGLGIGLVWGLNLLLTRADHAARSARLPSGWLVLRPPHEVSALSLSGDVLWAGGRDGITLLDRRSSDLLPLPPGTPDFHYVLDILHDREGRVWVAWEGGVSRLRPQGRWETLGESDGLPPGAASALYQDRDGSIWIGCPKGIFRYRAGQADLVQPAASLPISGVDKILEDRSGSMWFASGAARGGGLVRLDQGEWSFFSIKQGLAHNSVNTLLEDRTGALWAGTGFSRRGGASRLVDGAWHSLFKSDGLAGEKVRSLFEDREGRLWIGSEYDGIAVFYQGERYLLTPDTGLAGWEVKEMLQDQEGNYWLGTEDGVSRLSGVDWSSLKKGGA
ncbi:MAG: two-component regulator propeller domain-containing protein [Acidobacteriota bacterium]